MPTHDPANHRAPTQPGAGPGGARPHWLGVLRTRWRAYRATPHQKVGFWLGLLLLFAPIFYFLLYFKRYSVTARVGWGMWLGLIVFVKLNGLSEPVIDIHSIERQVTGKPEPAAEQVPIGTYLGKLEGGMLGFYVAGHQENGKTITVHFRRADDYFDSPEAVALASVASAFSLFYGRGYQRVVLDFNYRGDPVQVSIDRAHFRDFFGLSAGQMKALAADRKKFDASPVRNITPAGQRDFFKAFAHFQ